MKSLNEIALDAVKNGALVRSGPDFRFKPYFRDGKYEIVTRRGLIALGGYTVTGIGYKTLAWLRSEKHLRRVCDYLVEVPIPGGKTAHVKEVWYAYRPCSSSTTEPKQGDSP